MMTYGLQIDQLTTTRDCYASSKPQLHATREAIERFARKNDRLPLPAARNIGVDDVAYGREADAAQLLAGAIDQTAGASWGALPFQTLGLPTAYAGDCWGNKVTYTVTTALTTSASLGGFLDHAALGTLTIKSSTTASTTGAYAIISHGEDELGAVKLNYEGASHGWCSGSALKQLNCAANSATIANALLDPSLGATYFDDLVVAADKPQTIVPPGNLYCWGRNNAGQLGDATTTTRSTLTSVHGGAAYTTIASGHDFNCGLTAAGDAQCWGDNSSGQLGDGSSGTTRPEPVRVSGTGADPLSFIAIAAGYNHACGLNVTGDAYCWGDDSYGQLGDGAAGSISTTPVKVGGGLAFTRIAAGNARSCAITATNALYCWGANAGGGLGTAIGTITTPTLVSSGPFLSVSMHPDSGTQCAISSAGAAYCWGIGAHGELGNGSTTANSNAIVLVSGGLNFRTLAVGGTHVCGLTSAGAAYCWGSGTNGIVGNPAAAAAQTTPLAVVGGHVFSDLVAGTDHSCAHETGSLYCWGVNSDGNLGDGTTTNSSTPVKVSNTGTGSYVMGGMAAGNCHSCALAPIDRTYCWDANGSGQVGDGTTTARTTPTLVSGGAIFTSVIRTGNFSCGLTPASAAYCWGNNSNGTLGIGNTTASSTPVAVNGGYSFSKLSSGDALTCGLTTAGIGYCWGWNAYGQLGNGTTSTTNAPAGRVNSYLFRDLAAGWDHSCGIRDNGTAYCWGWNIIKQLAILSLNAYESSPQPILGGYLYTAMTAGASFTCGLRDNGSVYCWGTNLYGAMGNGLPGIDNILPLPVIGGLKFRQISAGTNHMCGLNQTGYPYCWGDNSSGQLGIGAGYLLSFAPVAVLVGGVATPFARIQSGSDQTCATTANGQAYCWGDVLGSVSYAPTLVNSPNIFSKGSQGIACAVAP